MKRPAFIIALVLVLATETASKADAHAMNATAHVISLTSINGGIEERREQKPFDTYDTCLAWKHQKEFLPPTPPALVSFVYCKRTEVRPSAEGTAVHVATSDLPSVPEPILAADVERKPERADKLCSTKAWMTEPKAFVVEVTRAPVPHVCTRTVSQEQLEAVLGWSVHAPGEEAASAYVHRSGEIVLADDLDYRDAVARSYFVHEMVHLQQYAGGAQKRASCIGLLEGEAYSLQARYLRRHGLKDDAFLFQILGLMNSACEIDY